MQTTTELIRQMSKQREHCSVETIRDLEQVMKQVTESLKTTNNIIVVGSLSPNKECQDRVRILSIGGGAKHFGQQTSKTRPKYLSAMPNKEYHKWQQSQKNF